MSDTVCLICGSTSHTSSSCPSDAAGELRKGRHTSRAQAHLQPAWPFGEGWVGELAQHYGKPEQRGQHNVGAPKCVAPSTDKFAPKRPKAGKSITLPGSKGRA